MPILGTVSSQISGRLDSNVMFPIAYAQVATTAVSSLTVSGIPSTYKHLRIYTWCRTTRSAYIDSMYMRFNGDSGSNYNHSGVEGESASTVAGYNAQSQTGIYWGRAGASTQGQLRGLGVVDIFNYSNTNITKSINSLSGIDYGGSLQGGNLITMVGGWNNTAAISSITFYPGVGPNIQTDSVFQIYGIK